MRGAPFRKMWPPAQPSVQWRVNATGNWPPPIGFAVQWEMRPARLAPNHMCTNARHEHSRLEASMEEDAIRILDSCRIMAISTVRSDGWPQTTIVGFANDALAIYFLIFRSSQKFANIKHDDRVSIAVGGEPSDIRESRAVYAGAHAAEVTNSRQRQRGWKLLVQRHPNLANFDLPDSAHAAMMRADCKYVSVVDYSKGLGHIEALTLDDGDARTVHVPLTDSSDTLRYRDRKAKLPD